MPNQEQLNTRHADAQTLVQDFDLLRDAEFFANPAQRVEFLKKLEYKDFFDIAQHVNARMRGYEPRDGQNRGERGGSLPFLRTPKSTEKQEAFQKGFESIQDYLINSDDTVEEKVKGAGMATEALLIWVHPFNDGNGRTARFLGTFIEDGTHDVDGLIASTVTSGVRQRSYGENLRVDKGNLYSVDDDIIMTDEEAAAFAEEIRNTSMPVADGIAQSIKHLLEDKRRQRRIEEKAAEGQEKAERMRQTFEKRQAERASKAA